MAVGCLMDKQKYRPSFYSLNQEGFIRWAKSRDNIVNRDIWNKMALAPLSAFHIQHCIEGRSWNSWTLDTMSDEWKPQQSLKNPMRKKMCACCFESLLSTSSPMTNSYTCLQLPLYPIKQVCNGKISERDPEVDIHKPQHPFFSLLCSMMI